MPTDPLDPADPLGSVLTRMAADVGGVAGVVGVTLGGSRARGTHRPDSDVDLGVYVETADGLDREALRSLARTWGGPDVDLGEAGSWGPWVDSGAWLRVDGVPVDWIVRDLSRVLSVWDAVQRGEQGFHPQPGHPLGFWDAAYVGELATARILADPTGRLARLREPMRVYPPRLRTAMIEGLWQADFVLDAARKAAPRGDTVYVAHCLAQALAITAHAHHARAGVWVTNEKGLIPAVAALPPESHDTRDFAGRADAAIRAQDLDEAGRLVTECRDAVRR